jgi:hypothetical protein
LTGFSKISPDYKGRFAAGGTIDPILAADLAPAAFGRVCGGASREIFIPGNTEKARGHNLRYVTANAFWRCGRRLDIGAVPCQEKARR